MSVAIITGITGQDGAYLGQFLLKKGYKVIGLTRSYNPEKLQNLKYLGISDKIEIKQCDLLNISQIKKIIIKYQPQEIYNLSAQSSVYTSFKDPIGTIQFNLLSVINLLEAIRIINVNIKFFQATSSEIFGNINSLPITENSILNPLSPYAISKASAHWFCINYRDSYNLFVCSGILFNHESFLRGENFFIKKVIREAINIVKKKQKVLKVGNIDIERDFGYAPKYVEGMFLIMQNATPNDFLICSGQSISLRRIIEYIFEKLDISKDKIIIEKSLYRPVDVPAIYGSNEKIKTLLGWDYSFNFFQILDILIEEELTSNWI